jgi:hypothetical protein
MTVSSGSVAIGTSPTLICTIGQDGALVSATAPGVFIGGANVAVTGVNAGVMLPAATTMTAPAVPASGVAVQNTASQAYTVVIATAGTISGVAVNGITVGAAAGTYVVPAYGAISVTWGGASPTWTWTATYANSPVYLPVPGAAARAIPFIGAGMDTAILYGISAAGGQAVSWITAATGSGT